MSIAGLAAGRLSGARSAEKISAGQVIHREAPHRKTTRHWRCLSPSLLWVIYLTRCLLVRVTWLITTESCFVLSQLHATVWYGLPNVKKCLPPYFLGRSVTHMLNTMRIAHPDKIHIDQYTGGSNNLFECVCEECKQRFRTRRDSNTCVRVDN